MDELQKEIESFLNIFNNAFEAHQLHSQHTIDIVEIESSIEQDRNKLTQAWEEFQKAKENLMLIQGPIEKMEKPKEELVKKEDLLSRLKPIQDELCLVHLKLTKHQFTKEAYQKNKYFLYFYAKDIV